MKEEALWNAHAREAALNRKFEEESKKDRERDAREQALEQREAMLKKGNFIEWAKQGKLDPVETLSRQLLEAFKEEEANQNPATRALREKAAEADGYRKQLTDIQQAQQRQAFMAEIDAELEKLSAAFVPALQEMKLPKNDVTMRLMSDAYEVNKKRGLGLTPTQLAQETHKAACGLVEGLLEGFADEEEVLDLFPNLTRKIHAAILTRHQKLTLNNQLGKVPAPKADPNKVVPAADASKAPRVLNSSEEDKAYFGDRRVLRSGI